MIKRLKSPFRANSKYWKYGESRYFITRVPGKVVMTNVTRLPLALPEVDANAGVQYGV